MTTSYYNLVRCKTLTIGTGTITIGEAIQGYLTPELAGVHNGVTVSYGIRDVTHSEVGHGIYNNNQLTRVVENSTDSNGILFLSGNAEVFFTVLARDLTNFSVVGHTHSSSGGEGNTVREDLTGQVDGVNTEFFVSHIFMSGSTVVYHNGIRERSGFDYEEFPFDGKIIFYSPPLIFGFTDTIELDYTYV
jgi:hypothetical protein